MFYDNKGADYPVHIAWDFNSTHFCLIKNRNFTKDFVRWALTTAGFSSQIFIKVSNFSSENSHKIMEENTTQKRILC